MALGLGNLKVEKLIATFSGVTCVLPVWGQWRWFWGSGVWGGPQGVGRGWLASTIPRGRDADVPFELHSHSCQAGWQWGPTSLWGYLSQLGPCCSLASDHIIKPCPGLVTPIPFWNRRPCNPPPPLPWVVLATYPNIWQPLSSPFQEGSIKTKYGR